MCFHAPLRPRKIDKFPFLRTTCEITKKKRENGNPTINYFIYEFHSNRNTCPTETEFVTCYPIILPSRQRFHSAKKMIHSDQHESPTTLPEFIYWKEVYLLASMVQSSSRGASFLLGPQRQNVGLVPTVNHGRKDSLRQDH